MAITTLSPGVQQAIRQARKERNPLRGDPNYRPSSSGTYNEAVLFALFMLLAEHAGATKDDLAGAFGYSSSGNHTFFYNLNYAIDHGFVKEEDGGRFYLTRAVMVMKPCGFVLPDHLHNNQVLRFSAHHKRYFRTAPTIAAVPPALPAAPVAATATPAIGAPTVPTMNVAATATPAIGAQTVPEVATVATPTVPTMDVTTAVTFVSPDHGCDKKRKERETANVTNKKRKLTSADVQETSEKESSDDGEWVGFSDDDSSVDEEFGDAEDYVASDDEE